MKTTVYEHELSAKTKAMFGKFAHECNRVQWAAGRLAVLREKGSTEEVNEAEKESARLQLPGVAEAEDNEQNERDLQLAEWERGQ